MLVGWYFLSYYSLFGDENYMQNRKISISTL